MTSRDYSYPWSSRPPWQQLDWSTERPFACARCGDEVQPWHRHFWQPCRKCCVWSWAGVCLMATFGLDGKPWIYWGARPWCSDCDGSGYLPCQNQDLSIMRRLGVCQECGAYSMVLMDWAGGYGDIENSGRHVDPDDPADHEVVVVAQPLVGALTSYLEHHREREDEG